MNIDKISFINVLLCLLILSVRVCYAAPNSNVAFFFSNNTHEIDPIKAYERLMNHAQCKLQNSAIDVLQANHIEQGRLESILGVYQMAIDGRITSDNTEVFYASPLQTLTDKQIFSLASQLAMMLDQESVAVFIPSDQAIVSDVIVKFRSRNPSIPQVINMIHQRLPALSSAFSLHLCDQHLSFNHDKITEVEWLKGGMDIEAIKKAFPLESISSHQGQAYLVYKNGRVAPL